MSIESHLHAARPEMERGRYDDALPHLQQAILIDPHNGQANFWMGQAIYLTGRSAEEALGHYETAAGSGFDPVRTAIYRGIVYAEAEQFQAALPLFEEAAQHDRTSDYARNCVEQTRRNLLGKGSTRDLYYPPAHVPHLDWDWLEGASIPQSQQFAIDCLPTLRQLLTRVPGPAISMLDVGTATGAGAALVANLFAGTIFGKSVRMDAIDLIRRYRPYARQAFPRVNYICGNLYDHDPGKRWDITMCSHTIEHMYDPTPLIRHCQDRAKHFALLYAPFEEDRLIAGHLRSIRRDYVESLHPLHWEIIQSPGWTHPEDPQSRTVIFVLPGKG